MYEIEDVFCYEHADIKAVKFEKGESFFFHLLVSLRYLTPKDPIDEGYETYFILVASPKGLMDCYQKYINLNGGGFLFSEKAIIVEEFNYDLVVNKAIIPTVESLLFKDRRRTHFFMLSKFDEEDGDIENSLRYIQGEEGI